MAREAVEGKQARTQRTQNKFESFDFIELAIGRATFDLEPGTWRDEFDFEVSVPPTLDFA